jgi:hypothetical protein
MTARARSLGRAAAGAAVCIAVAQGALAAPAAGRYDAQLCVAMAAAHATCGAVDAALDANGAALLRAADIVYVLKLRPKKLDVVLMQGSTQLDEFSVPYRWDGDALTFVDDEKNARYEVRFGKRKP